MAVFDHALPAIVVDEEPTVNPAISIDPGYGEDKKLIPIEVPMEERPAPIPPQVAESRASKFKYGLDAILKKSKDEIFSDITQGQEGYLRLQAAGEIDQRKREQTEKVINAVIGSKGGPLTVEESFGIQQIIDNMNQKTDPSSVLEESYAKTFMDTFDTMASKNPNSTPAQVKQHAPHLIAEMQAGHGDRIKKREFAVTLSENIDSEIAEQGWLPWGVDLVKQAVPTYTDIKLRGNVPGVGVTEGIGLGPNLEAQRKELLRLPFPEYKAKLTAIAEGLRKDNPQMASTFVKAVVGMSVDDVFINSSVLPLDVAGIGLGKLAVKGLKTLRPEAVKQTEKAVIDIAKEAANPNASKSTVEAASGDLEAAAVTRVTTSNVWEAIGTGRTANDVVERQVLNGEKQATVDAVDALSQTLRADETFVAEKPGRYGQEIVNRIVESSRDITQKLFQAVREVSKIDRLPEIMSNEVAVKAILESIKKTYTGINNAVIHMGKPYREPIANRYLVDMHLGRPDGTYFKDEDVAKNFIEAQGLADAKIVKGDKVEYTLAGAKSKKIDKDIEGAQRIINKNVQKMNNKGLSEADRAKAAEQVSLAEDYITDLKSQKSALDASSQVATVEQQGFGYYIKITKPINETDAVVRSFIAETTNTKIPEGVIARFINGSPLGKLRTPEETLSLAERQNRLTATYSPSVYFDLMRQNAPTLDKVLSPRFGKGRNRRKEFERILKEAQRMKDPDFPEDPPGYFFKSPEELEETYLRIHNRLPDKDEIVAYFEFKRGMEMDRVFRNVAEVRNQSRVGAETHKIATVDDTGATVYSTEFSAVTRKKLSAADDNILIMGEKSGEARVRSLQGMSKKERDELQKEIDSGAYRFLEVYAPEHKPLKGFEGLTERERVRYVLAKTVETRELEWNQVPRRGGGHMEADYDFYLKQASVTWDEVGKRWWYEGDTTLMPIQVSAMGKKVANHLNRVRKLLQDKDEAGAMAYSNKNLHIDWDEVRSWFHGRTDDAGKKIPPRLSLREPIQLLRKNENIQSIDKDLERRFAGELAGTVHSNFKNGLKEGSLSRQSQVEYNVQRDAFDLITLTDEGTRNNPLYKIAPAELVDPITTMNRGLSRIAKSNFMDDYKTMSVEHWLKQASKYLEASDQEIWHAPFFHFHEAKFKKNAPVEVVNALKTAKYHTEQLTGTPSSTDAMLHTWAQRAHDTLYTSLGAKNLSRLDTITPDWVLPVMKDPFGFMRSVVFHAKMGLYNIPQFVVQANNYTNIYGIAGPKYAAPGTVGAQLHFWSRVNSRPEIINHLDSLASKLSVPGASKWRPGEFKEAWEELRKTGFGNVGNEYATLDNPMSEKIITTSFGKFLDFGTTFFKAGERNSRYGAWYTAFKEFRDANPVGRLTEADRAGILQRADLLSINMSRASSSALHQGALSIPTQFYTYQIRLMELMTSNRISTNAKISLFWTNAAMYGIPMATGLSGLPVADYIRKRAMDGSYGERYVVGDKFLPTLFMEGLPSMIMAVATGGGDYQKGTFYDVGSRFGTKGLEFIGGLDRTDRSPLDMAGGAAWSVIKGTWEQSDGFRRAMMSFIKGDKETFPFVMEDVIDVGKEISTVNSAASVWAAAMTGRAISKKENYLADTTMAQALFKAAFGLKDQKITDIQTMTNYIKEISEGERTAEKQFEQEFRRGLLAKDDNELRHRHWTRAAAVLELLGYPEDRISDLVDKAMRNNESMVNKLNFDFYIKRAPDAVKQSGREAMERIQELDKKKTGEE
jgi:hypothetical protein